MNEDSIQLAAESIAKQKNKESKITQLRSEIPGEKIEYEKLVEEMKRTDLSEEDLEAISEFKESFEMALIRKSKEIIPLLEKEIDMYQKDLNATEKHLLASSDDEASLTYKGQIDYLNEKLNNLHQEIIEYQNILKL
ncbi:MAG: hypothetical protein WCT50_03355 [Patescibacteria group bacterium]